MSESQYTIRNYLPSDFDSYVQLHIEAENHDRAGHCTSLRTLCEILGRPNYSPENDLFLAEREGKVVGYMNLTPELGIGRVILSCLIHPENRRKGLATQLCHESMRRASSLGAKVVQGCISQGNTPAENWASKLGFGYARRFLELKMKLSDEWITGTGSGSITCRHLRLGEESVLAELQNRSFTGTWGYHPGAVEEIAYRVNLRDCSPEGIILVCEGDRPLGYCWTTVSMDEITTSSAGRGRIHMIGVIPEHRGRGLGRCALMAGLRYLKSRGAEEVDLTVDGDNREACDLYESVGFEICSTTVWYEKALE